MKDTIIVNRLKELGHTTRLSVYRLLMKAGPQGLSVGVLQKKLRVAKKASGINKSISPHIFRHSFATHMLENGKSIEQVKELLGHEDIRTTEIYLHAMRDPSRDESIMDKLNIVI